MKTELLTAASKFKTGKVRKEKLQGRDYYVAPASMLVPGVLNGSRGPVYYPEEEASLEPQIWNHVPLVVYHPMENGKFVSARSPEVLEKYGVGLVLRAGFNGKLRSEAWFDIDNTRRVDERVLQSLENNEPLELSTGLSAELEPAEEGAVYNGRSYTHIARNFKPDHLAVLPDQVGACSLDDGCGVLANAQTSGCACELPSSSSWSEVGSMETVLANVDVSYDQHMEEVRSAFYQAHPTTYDPKTGYPESYCYVIAVFDDYVVYCEDYREDGHMETQLYRQNYTVKGGKVAMSGSPKPVRRVVSYEPVANATAYQWREIN